MQAGPGEGRERDGTADHQRAGGGRDGRGPDRRAPPGRCASLLCGAETPDGEAFARAYDGTGETLISELREMERGPEPDRTPGTPHPDPRLAGHGWRTCEHGIYVRRQVQAEAQDPEAA